MADPSLAAHAADKQPQGPQDVLAKVTGAARYATDIEMPRTAHAVLVRSPVAHGMLKSIDVGAAEAMPGVVCTVTGADLADIDPFYGELIFDQPALALDHVRYAGEPVCGVIAETRAIAWEAANLVDVEIEPLTPVLGAEEALRPAAPLIHPDRQTEGEAHPNVCREVRVDVGDVDEAFARAAYVHDAVYTCPAVSHYTMEPHCSMASWVEGRLEVVSGTQQPFRVRDCLARMFGLPQSQVDVRAPHVGGAYGGKGETKYEPLVAAMARKAGRPVKLACSVEESFKTITRHAASVRIRTAVDGDGNMIGRDTEILFDTGAYADKGPRIARRGAHRVVGPYKIPNVRAVSRAVYTNTVPAGAFRGFSTSQVLWAEESAMDEIAEALGEDPIEFRMRQLLDRGEPFGGFDSPMDADLRGGLALAAGALEASSSAGKPTGTGLAAGVKDGGGGAGLAKATVHLHLDGSVEVLAGATDIGQGPARVLAALAASELGVSLDRVTVRLGDTASAPFDRGTNASRTTVGVGAAVVDACQRIDAQLRAALGAVLGTEDYRIDGDFLVTEDNRATFTEVLAGAFGVPPREVGSLSGQGVHEVGVDPETKQSKSLFYEVCFSAAEVTVDEDTGEVTVTRFANVTDVGKALDRLACEGQDLGAAMMGIGSTLTEQLVYVDGHLVNPNIVEYRVPTPESLPRGQFTSTLIENADGPGPQGAKGVGEAGIVAVAPAIGNAFTRATGVRIRDLPLSPERVWRALRNGRIEGRTGTNEPPQEA